MHDLLQLLGKNVNDPVLTDYIRELEELGSRGETHDNAYLDYPQSGICFYIQQGFGVSSIFLYSEGHEEHRSFQRPMPNGLAFTQSREQLRNRFSVLLKEGGGDIGVRGKVVPFWDLFLWRLHHIHVQYSDDLAGAKLITLSFPDEKIPDNKAASSEQLVIFCIPSLVSTLLNRENKKGAALTEEEVLAIRDNAPAIALRFSVAKEVEIKRGYQDIDADNVWDEWQKARLSLM